MISPVWVTLKRLDSANTYRETLHPHTSMQTEQHITLLKSLSSRRRRLRALSAIGLLSFLLLFVQSADLVHSHETDTGSTIHCDICLKAGSLEHGLAFKAVPAPVLSPLAEFIQPEFQLSKSPRLTPVARAPPLHS